MSYPLQCQRVYVNPYGNIMASGVYRSPLTQRMANDFPEWMHIRQNPRSIGQQFLSSSAVAFDKIEKDLNYNIKSKFLSSAPIEEIDILYRVAMPSNLDLTNASASGVRCIAAPSGYAASSINQIWVSEVTDLGDFYYNVLPTRVEVSSSGVYQSTIDGFSWNVKPSGILDQEAQKYDVWKIRHDLTWCYSDGFFRKQDYETMEDYEIYALNYGCGTPLDMIYDSGYLWWVGKSGSNYFLNMASSKTYEPAKVSLDLLASFNINNSFDGLEPSGIIVDKDRVLWICDTNKTRVFEVNPRYDYFTMDKVNRYIYFREDYTYSGVFVSNT